MLGFRVAIIQTKYSDLFGYSFPKMKRRLVILLLALSGDIKAEWIWISDDIISSWYIDPSSILKTPTGIKVWSLQSFNRSNGKYNSLRALIEFNCAGEESRILSESHHSGTMGKGETVETGLKALNWDPVSPDSIGHLVFNFACNKHIPKTAR